MDKNNIDIVAILNTAIEKTSRKSLDWQSVSGTNRYKVDFAKSSMVVWKNRDAYGFAILNSRGDTIANIQSGKLDDTHRSKIIELHDAVVNSHMQIEETINDIMEGLEGRSKPEEPPF